MMFCAVSLQHKITLAGMTSQSLRNLIACPRATVTFTWAWLIRNLICSISRSTSQEYLRTMGCRFLVQLLSPEYKQNDLIKIKYINTMKQPHWFNANIQPQYVHTQQYSSKCNICHHYNQKASKLKRKKIINTQKDACSSIREATYNTRRQRMVVADLRTIMDIHSQIVTWTKSVTQKIYHNIFLTHYPAQPIQT